jgi:hypothetical protein
VSKSRGFAHSILWIFMGLSTATGGLLFARVFLAVCKQGRGRGSGWGWRHRRSRKIFGEPAVFEAKQVQVSKPDRQPGGSLIEVEEFFGQASKTIRVRHDYN